MRERLKGETVEMVKVKRDQAFPDLPNKNLVIDISANHPRAVRIKVTVKEGDGRDIGEMSGIRQFDIPRAMIFRHKLSKL